MAVRMGAVARVVHAAIGARGAVVPLAVAASASAQCAALSRERGSGSTSTSASTRLTSMYMSTGRVEAGAAEDSAGKEESSNAASGNAGEATGGRLSGGIPISGSPVSWASLLLAAATGALGLAFYRYEFERKVKGRTKTSTATADAVVNQEGQPHAGRALLGGPFTLVTCTEEADAKPAVEAVRDNGTVGPASLKKEKTKTSTRMFTDKDLRGRWSMLYFGFTFCPDICPTELEKLAEAVDLLKKEDALDVTPVFISIDPERDTPEQVHSYVKGARK